MGQYLEIADRLLYYKKLGEGQPAFVLLGWHASIDDFPYDKVLEKNREYLDKNKLIFIQLSNFGKSSYSPSPYFLKDYSQELEKVAEKFEINKFNLIGHSAGGRIALHFTHSYPLKVKKLALLSSAGLKHKPLPEDRLEHVKKYFRKPKANPQKTKLLRETFKNLYNSDLTTKIGEIENRTIIIWGNRDKVIKVNRANKFDQLLKNGKLVIYKNLGHSTIDKAIVWKKLFKFLENEK